MKQIRTVLVTFLLVFLLLTSKGQAACAVTDEEEYQVFVAVLFPAEPDIPDDKTSDVERRAYPESIKVRLYGFHGSSYRLRDWTVAAKLPAGGSDQTLESDFNGKNEKECRIDQARLSKGVPEGGRLTFISPDEIRKQFSTILRGGEARLGPGATLAPRGFAVLSRPGFNEDPTETIIEAGFRAGPEMGTGYRVRLKKSPRTGKWFIAAAAQTLIY
jgi:hypothetical protein